MSDKKILRVHTDRFSLFEKVRKGRQNNRNYMLEAVKSMFNSPETQEGLRLGELFGYYGHCRRQITGQMDLPETAVVMVEGKAVVLDNVPACRTVAISVDDDGIVTHTQEIFDTAPGRIVSSMLEARAGGWSWVTTGRDSPSISIPKSFYGCDYVKNPNFISMDHPAAMHESAESRDTAILESLRHSGYSDEDAENISQHFTKLSEHQEMVESIMRLEELESAQLIAAGQLLEQGNQLAEKDRELSETKTMLESLQAAQQTKNDTEKLRCSNIQQALDRLPVFTNKAHARALASMESDADIGLVTALFESLAKLNSQQLPNLQNIPQPENAAQKQGFKVTAQAITFSDDVPQFGQH